MNYTENYQLPQWEETDRIMRIDFNDAMAGIERGLSHEKTERLALEEQMRLAEAGTSAAARTAIQNGLFRLAYNRWYYLTSLAEVPRQVGFFRQGFARDEKSPVGGMLQMEDRLWTANGDAALTLDNLRPTFKQLSTISSNKSSDTFSMTFTPPASGWLTALWLTGNYSGNTGAHNSGACTLRMYDDAKNTLLASISTSLHFASTSGAGKKKIPMDYILHGKQKYRIEVQLAALDITCGYQADLNGDCLEVIGRKQETTAFSHRFQLDEASQGGMILVHYDTWGTGGGVSMDWQGETFAPYKIRTVTDQGRTVKEAEFRIGRAIPADSTATLNVRCEKGGEFSLYGWGGMLI